MNQPLPKAAMDGGRSERSQRLPRTPNDPILKDTRTCGCRDFRDACEMNFDAPEEARRRIRHMLSGKKRWTEAT